MDCLDADNCSRFGRENGERERLTGYGGEEGGGLGDGAGG